MIGSTAYCSPGLACLSLSRLWVTAGACLICSGSIMNIHSGVRVSEWRPLTKPGLRGDGDSKQVGAVAVHTNCAGISYSVQTGKNFFNPLEWPRFLQELLIRMSPNPQQNHKQFVKGHLMFYSASDERSLQKHLWKKCTRLCLEGGRGRRKKKCSTAHQYPALKHGVGCVIPIPSPIRWRVDNTSNQL